MRLSRAPLYFCLRVPEFPAQALLRLRPMSRAQPVAVLEGKPPLERVCAVNAAARRIGVEHGLTRAELSSFQQVHVLDRSPGEEASTRAALLQLCETFTPRCQDLRLSLQPEVKSSADKVALVLALDMTGTERIFNSTSLAAHTLLEALRGLRLSARIVGSMNIHAGVCVARVNKRPVELIPGGKEREALATLSVSALAADVEEAETLSLWGIRTAGELAGLPEADVAARLGEPGRRLLRLARGEQSHPFVPEQAAFSLSERVEFDAPVDTLDSLLFVLGPMLCQLLVRAGYRALAVASVTVTLGLEGAPDHVRTVKPALPLFDHQLLLKLMHLDLQAHPPAAGVLTVSVSAEPGPRPDVQTGLFSPQQPPPAQLEVTLARIKALVGDGCVGRAVLADRHAPEAFHMERFVVKETPLQGAACSHSCRAHEPGHTHTGIALRRLRPPASIFMQRDGRALPHAFSFNHMRYTVHRAFGPWRRSGQWWTTDVWSREEWDMEAEAKDGARLLCLVVHDLLRQSWHLEGVYD